MTTENAPARPEAVMTGEHEDALWGILMFDTTRRGLGALSERGTTYRIGSNASSLVCNIPGELDGPASRNVVQEPA